MRVVFGFRRGYINRCPGCSAESADLDYATRLVQGKGDAHYCVAPEPPQKNAVTFASGFSDSGAQLFATRKVTLPV